jgi:hypothetical protein
MLLVSGEIGEKEKAYGIVEQFCNKAIVKIDGTDLSPLIWSKVDKRTILETKRDLDIIFNASPRVRQCFLQALATVFGAACANSPGILVLVAPLIVFSVTALWFNKVRSWLIGLVTRFIGNLCFHPA